MAKVQVAVQAYLIFNLELCSIWLLNNTFQEINITGFFFSLLLKRWPWRDSLKYPEGKQLWDKILEQ